MNGSPNFAPSYVRGALKIVGGKNSLRSDTLSGSYALDTSVIIEMLVSSTLGRYLTDALIADSAQAYTSEVNLAEAEYVLCRKLGSEASKTKLDNLRKSNYAVVADTEQVSGIAAQIKCERRISFADCYSLPTSKVTASKALFAFREKELMREIRRDSAGVEVIFLEDLAEKT
jgi:predicted nucleic acid-binding protein